MTPFPPPPAPSQWPQVLMENGEVESPSLHPTAPEGGALPFWASAGRRSRALSTRAVSRALMAGAASSGVCGPGGCSAVWVRPCPADKPWAGLGQGRPPPLLRWAPLPTGGQTLDPA